MPDKETRHARHPFPPRQGLLGEEQGLDPGRAEITSRASLARVVQAIIMVPRPYFQDAQKVLTLKGQPGQQPALPLSCLTGVLM